MGVRGPQRGHRRQLLRQLEKCLTAYFGDAFIRQHYKTTPQNRVILTVKTLVHS